MLVTPIVTVTAGQQEKKSAQDWILGEKNGGKLQKGRTGNGHQSSFIQSNVANLNLK